MNISKHRERIEKVFTVDNALKYVEFAIKAATNSLQFEEIQEDLLHGDFAEGEERGRSNHSSLFVPDRSDRWHEI